MQSLSLIGSREEAICGNAGLSFSVLSETAFLQLSCFVFVRYYGSYTLLVKKAHQQSTLRTSIRSHSDSRKCIHSSAIAFSPKVCKIELFRQTPFTLMRKVIRNNFARSNKRGKIKIYWRMG